MAKISYIRPSRFFLRRLYPDLLSWMRRLTLISSLRVGVTFWAAMAWRADFGVRDKRLGGSGRGPGARPPGEEARPDALPWQRSRSRSAPPATGGCRGKPAAVSAA